MNVCCCRRVLRGCCGTTLCATQPVPAAKSDASLQSQTHTATPVRSYPLTRRCNMKNQRTWLQQAHAPVHDLPCSSNCGPGTPCVAAAAVDSHPTAAAVRVPARTLATPFLLHCRLFPPRQLGFQLLQRQCAQVLCGGVGVFRVMARGASAISNMQPARRDRSLSHQDRLLTWPAPLAAAAAPVTAAAAAAPAPAAGAGDATGGWPPHAACSDMARLSSMSGSICLASSSVTGCRLRTAPAGASVLLPPLLLAGAPAAAGTSLLAPSVSAAAAGAGGTGRGVGRMVAAARSSSSPSSCAHDRGSTADSGSV
jgi:hypothetical protein